MNYRKSIFWNYSTFFGKQSSENTKETQPATNNMDSKWMWLMMVDKLCKELNMIPTQVYEMNYLAALNFLSMYHLKAQQQKQNGNN